MDDYALVLNAGSSSLKFCVFQRRQGRLACRGPRARSKDRYVASVPVKNADGKYGMTTSSCRK